MEKRPNIILITIDALRSDHLGFMGYQKEVSPNIDVLSKESTVFTRAFATGPSTPHSFPGILTSTYPLDYQGSEKMEKPRVLISEVLKKQGYITAAFHSNPYLSDYFGYNQGWDFFEDITFSGDMEEALENRKGNLIQKKFLAKVFGELTFIPFYELFFRAAYWLYKRISPRSNYKVKAAAINQLARDFISYVKEEKKPIFIWIHYMDVHGPYLSLESYYQDKPPSYLEFISRCIVSFSSYFQKKPSRKFLKNYSKKIIDLYDQSIKYVDQQLGKLLEFFKKENVYQNSIICLTSDHGDEFWEHGGTAHNPKLYNELLQVPLLMKIPELKNRIIEKKVSLIDLSSTLCDLVKVGKPATFKGKNLFDSSTFPIFHQVKISSKQYKIGCQSNNWKYILDFSNGKEELYNLSKDPKEKNNLSKSEPKILSQMKERIKEFEKENPPFSIG